MNIFPLSWVKSFRVLLLRCDSSTILCHEICFCDSADAFFFASNATSISKGVAELYKYSRWTAGDEWMPLQAVLQGFFDMKINWGRCGICRLVILGTDIYKRVYAFFPFVCPPLKFQWRLKSTSFIVCTSSRVTADVAWFLPWSKIHLFCPRGWFCHQNVPLQTFSISSLILWLIRTNQIKNRYATERKSMRGSPRFNLSFLQNQEFHFNKKR